MKKLWLICALLMLLPSLGHSQTNILPDKFQEADLDNDGLISIPEVRDMIDGFFIGKHDHGVMYIHELIDYFFEQKS